jgi:hypothetical protein
LTIFLYTSATTGAPPCPGAWIVERCPVLDRSLKCDADGRLAHPVPMNHQFIHFKGRGGELMVPISWKQQSWRGVCSTRAWLKLLDLPMAQSKGGNLPNLGGCRHLSKLVEKNFTCLKQSRAGCMRNSSNRQRLQPSTTFCQCWQATRGRSEAVDGHARRFAGGRQHELQIKVKARSIDGCKQRD